MQVRTGHHYPTAHAVVHAGAVAFLGVGSSSEVSVLNVGRGPDIDGGVHVFSCCSLAKQQLAVVVVLLCLMTPHIGQLYLLKRVRERGRCLDWKVAH
jgi:hypothetical protein